MDIDDIRDFGSFDTWLKETDQSRENCVWLAHRAAMRVAPRFWGAAMPARPDAGLMALPICRALLISGIASVVPSPDITRGATTARIAAANAANAAATARAAATADAATYAAANAATAAANAAATATSRAAATATATAADAYAYADATRAAADARAAARAAAWIQNREDCRNLSQGAPSSPVTLWETRTPPDPGWPDISTAWRNQGGAWRFWADWYDAALAGKPLDLDMLTQIALIDPEIWDGDPEELDRQIVEIYAHGRAPKTTEETHTSTSQKMSELAANHVASAIRVNRPVLTPTLDAISGLISLEVARLQARNYKSDEEMEECKRLIGVFLSLEAATSQLAASIPSDRAVSEADADAIKPLLAAYADHASCWWRDNASDLVDSTFRLGLTAITAAPLVYCGVPAHVAYLATGLAFGGKKLASGAKDIANNLKPDGG